ncbi:MAG: hypothetical protein HY321_23095 [Armatimonadetes bacterium]|nr:hypothetical protein [Armatimonadota bacterium]
MNRRVIIAVVVLMAWGVSAGAQFQDIVQGMELLKPGGGRHVTMDLRRAPAAEAVAKLSEAAGVAMVCDLRLAERKVTLAARDWAANDVAGCLARALGARWRRDDRRLLLEPAEMIDILAPREVASEVRSALQSGLRGSPRPAPEDLVREISQSLGSLPPERLEVLRTREGVPLASLPAEHQQQLAAFFYGTLLQRVDNLTRALGQVGSLEGIEVRLEETPIWGLRLSLLGRVPGGLPLIRVTPPGEASGAAPGQE